MSRLDLIAALVARLPSCACGPASDLAEEMHALVPLLREWERTFTTYLSVEAPRWVTAAEVELSAHLRSNTPAAPAPGKKPPPDEADVERVARAFADVLADEYLTISANLLIPIARAALKAGLRVDLLTQEG